VVRIPYDLWTLKVVLPNASPFGQDHAASVGGVVVGWGGGGWGRLGWGGGGEGGGEGGGG